MKTGWMQGRCAWVIDGPGEIGTLYANGVGKVGFEITVKGKAAHAGICPEKGIHAFVLATGRESNHTPAETTTLANLQKQASLVEKLMLA